MWLRACGRASYRDDRRRASARAAQQRSRVRVRHQSRFPAQPVDVLEHKERLAAGRDPGVDKVSDVGVCESREDGALASSTCSRRAWSVPHACARYACRSASSRARASSSTRFTRGQVPSVFIQFRARRGDSNACSSWAQAPLRPTQGRTVNRRTVRLMSPIPWQERLL
jgi:hypothetical protein